MCSAASVSHITQRGSNPTYDIERVRNPKAHEIPRAPLATFRFDCVDHELGAYP